MKSILKYFVEPICINHYNDTGYAVFERLNGGVRKLAVFYGNETSAGDAEIFAKAKLGGLKNFPNGFENWAETHYQIVSSIERAIDNQTPNVATSVQEDHGLGGLWELSVNLTDLFEEKHKDQYPTWDLDYFDKIEEFIDNELFEAYSANE